jgi:hypothetical protein
MVDSSIPVPLEVFDAEEITVTLTRAEWSDILASVGECAIRSKDLELERLASRLQEETLPHELRRDDLLVRSIHRVSKDRS